MPETEVVLAAEDVTVTFEGKAQSGGRSTVTACDHVSLELHKGEVLSLIHI